jgi:peptide-methionine (R)-S-oxide reductase
MARDPLAGAGASALVQASYPVCAVLSMRVQFRVIRLKGTEPAGTGEYVDNKTAGIYSCAACDTPLYKSGTKFNSGCGWPAFFDGVLCNTSRCVL